MKYDILTEHLTMFWFPMIINEYTAEFQSTKTSKDAKFKQCLYLKLPLPPCYEQNRCAECTFEIHDKDSLMYNKQLLDEVYYDMKIINCRDIDNFAYHKNRIQ